MLVPSKQRPIARCRAAVIVWASLFHPDVGSIEGQKLWVVSHREALDLDIVRIERFCLCGASQECSQTEEQRGDKSDNIRFGYACLYLL